MHRLTGIALLIIYFIALLKPIAPVLDYVINKEHIAKVFCENKAKPKMQCAGKCHLKKELKKSAEKPINSETAPRINILDYPIGFVEFFKHNTPVLNLNILNPFYTENYHFDFLQLLFRPPQFY